MEITIGIGSTTHIDKHNEKMSKSALDGIAEQIKDKYIPQLIEHDWDRHIGVILYGEVFKLHDGEYALGIVTGCFENEEDRNKFKIGQKNSTWTFYKKYLDIETLQNLHKNKKVNHPNNKPAENIVDHLELFLDSTGILPNGNIYKTKRYIASTGDLKIEVYPKDHWPAHFHVISEKRKINARFNINTLELINLKKGKIKNNDVKKIQTFFIEHSDYLEKLKKEYTRLNNETS